MIIAESEGAIARQDFLNAMAGVATSVAVVATDGPAGCFGVTVSAFASVSADPPMILVCINRRSPVVRAIDVNGSMTLNILASHQSAIADVFAGRSTQHRNFDFSCAEWDDCDRAGARHLCDAAVSLHAHVSMVQDVETHVIVLGKVVSALRSGNDPLIYTRGCYGKPLPLSDYNPSTR